MTRSPHAAVVVVSLAVSLALQAAAQEQPPQLPKPGAEHARLKTLEGTWDTVTTTAEGKKSKGEATYKMECGGLWLASDFKGEFDGQPFQGKGLDTYDTHKNKLIGVWVDSMLTSPLIMEGTRDSSSQTTTMTGQTPGPGGQPLKFKGVTKETDANHMTFEMYLVGSDGQETKMMTVAYTRRK